MNLSEILRGFNASINEEQAWAICHQHAKRMIEKPASEDGEKYFALPAGLESIILEQDGEVLVASNKTVNTERDMVEAFGRVLFEALEFGLDESDHELELSAGLERLIERMTLSYDGIQAEEDDEGYDAEDEEDFSLDHGPCTLDVVVRLCEEHLERPNEADAHYLAVCRALITEAVDLKSFLERVSSAKESVSAFANLNNNNDISTLDCDKEDFPELNFTEWAHLWIQVVTDLRSGVKLKKVEGYTRNVEFELTPYEILMEDIRQRKYTLKKVAINGDIPPRIKHNAHDIILEFIKSRPSLNPSQNRKLRPPPPRSKSLHELLLEQIQENSTPLRHVDPPDDSPLRKRRSSGDLSMTTSKSFDLGRCGTSKPTPLSAIKRRLIKAPTLSEIQGDGADLSFDSDSDTGSDCSDLSEEDFLSTTANDDSTSSPFKRHSVISNTSSVRSSGTSGVSSSGADDLDGAISEKVGGFRRNTTTIRGKKLLSVSLLPSPVLTPVPDTSFDSVPPLRQSGFTPRGVGVRRANSMAATRTPSFLGAGCIINPANLEERRNAWRDRRMRGLNQFTVPESVPLPPSSSSPLAKRDKRDLNFTRPSNGPGPAKLQRAFSERRQSVTKTAQHDAWKYPAEYLALTVEELIHIREVLARADIETYQGRGELYSNLKKGKVCFNCRIRKFSLLTWACSCQICKQKICSKCMRKIRTPTNEYLQTPVYTLSPSLKPNPVTGNTFFNSENFQMPSARLPTSMSTSVLRERNEADVTSGLLRQQYTLSGSKSRKMDVCEKCCEVISGIIHTNQFATYQSPGQLRRQLGHQMSSSPSVGCWSSRPPTTTDQLLRRSASTANHFSSYLTHRNGAPPSTVQSIQASVR